MPDNPISEIFGNSSKNTKEKNDYVFFLFSAGQICEVSKQFSFYFENPVKD